MIFTTVLTAFIVSRLLLVAFAAPAGVNIVCTQYPIIYPNSSSILWYTGSYQNVTWETDEGSLVQKGTVLLSKGGVVNPVPLATGLTWNARSTQIMVPLGLEPGEDYAIILAFATAETSPDFTITINGSASSSLPAPVTSVTGTYTTTVLWPNTTIVTTISPTASSSVVCPIDTTKYPSGSSSSVSATPSSTGTSPSLSLPLSTRSSSSLPSSSSVAQSGSSVATSNSPTNSAFRLITPKTELASITGIAIFILAFLTV